MTTDQVYIGVGLTIVLAVGCQVLGARLRIPALLLLLPAGFIAGSLTDDINPNHLLGTSFQPLVSLSVAVILYDAGTGLTLSKLTGHTRRVVVRLLALGTPITWLAAALVAAPLFGMAKASALMFGAILVVSGPTVVGPLLAAVRPKERLRHVLMWEGSLIDPLGGLLGAVVFHAVSASTRSGLGRQIAQFAGSLAIGVVGGAVGAVVLWLLLVKLRLSTTLSPSAQLAVVIAIAAACDGIRDDTGLIAAIMMGLAVANMRVFDVPARQPFFEVLVQLIIGLLFISISATVTPASIQHLIWPALGLVAVLVLVVRPLVAALSTVRTDLTGHERAFVGWMAPRGIVAAATASTFSASLAADGVSGASKILPGTFLVIVATVTVYGLTAVPVARRLGVTRATVSRPLIVGGEPWVIDLGRTLNSTGLTVVMWAETVPERARITDAGIELAPDSLIADATGRGAEIEGVTAILLLTGETGFNALAATLLRGGEGGRVYRAASTADAGGTPAPYAGGDVLFGPGRTRDMIVEAYRNGARFSVGAAGADSPDGGSHDGNAIFARVRADGRLAPVTALEEPIAEPGDRTVWFGPLSAAATGPDNA